ncbi:unnamed protein product [Diamesa serratosioi]
MILSRHLLVYCALSSVTISTCYFGDKLVQRTHKNHVLRAIYDNLTHSLIGLFSAAILLINDKDKLYLAGVCMVLSSIIDVDHFIAAKSLKLTDATNLNGRPFLHNSTIPATLLIILIYLSFSSKYSSYSLWISMLFIAFTTHHLRDANRRGLWFAPFGETPPLSNLMYILLIVSTPYFLNLFPKTGRYTKNFPNPLLGTSTNSIFDV